MLGIGWSSLGSIQKWQEIRSLFKTNATWEFGGAFLVFLLGIWNFPQTRGFQGSHFYFTRFWVSGSILVVIKTKAIKNFSLMEKDIYTFSFFNEANERLNRSLICSGNLSSRVINLCVELFHRRDDLSLVWKDHPF